MTYNEDPALELLGAGDERGFRLLYERHALGVTKIAYKFLKSPALADDLVQDVFTKVWVEREKFSKVDNFRAYIYRVTTNLAYDHLKMIAKFEIAKTHYQNEQEIAANNIDHYLKDKDYTALIHQAVDGLPPQTKRVYELVRDRGLSHKEVAEQLAISTITVESHMVHALKFIRAKLTKHLITAGYVGISLCHRMVDLF